MAVAFVGELIAVLLVEHVAGMGNLRNTAQGSLCRGSKFVLNVPSIRLLNVQGHD